MQRRIVLHCPDITLKGQNQREFQDTLVGNVRHVLDSLGIQPEIGSARGRVYVDITMVADAETAAMMETLARVPGISSLGAATWLPPASLGQDAATFNWSLVENTVTDMAQAVYEPGKSFAVRMNRADKALPVGTVEMERRLGDVIRQGSGWDRVNLKHPDREFNLDAYGDGLYLYPKKYQGVGGLPIGTGARVLALLSGGIDSPVAAAMLAKRGCVVDGLHIAATTLDQFDPENAQVARLARQLSHYTQRTRLYVVPYVHFDLALSGDQAGYELILFRRFLLRAAEFLSRRIHTAAIAMGDSLGQVASQTMENIIAATAATTLPVLRPLIAFNKQEIIDSARRMGTFPISIEPHKDCCALLSRNPRTRSDPERMAWLETQVVPDYPALLARTFAETLRLDFDCGRLVSTRPMTFAAQPTV